MTYIYLKLPKIQGSVTTKNYEGWIGLHSVNYQIENHHDMLVGRARNRTSEFPHLSELIVIKQLDKATNKLFEAASVNKLLGQAEIHLCSTDNPPKPYMKYLLDNVLIGHYQQGTMSHGKPREIISLNFTKLTINYIEQDAQGKSASPVISSFDLETAQLN